MRKDMKMYVWCLRAFQISKIFGDNGTHQENWNVSDCSTKLFVNSTRWFLFIFFLTCYFSSVFSMVKKKRFWGMYSFFFVVVDAVLIWDKKKIYGINEIKKIWKISQIEIWYQKYNLKVIIYWEKTKRQFFSQNKKGDFFKEVNLGGGGGRFHAA